MAHLQITDKLEKQSKHNKWNANPLLKAASEIANTAKHFELRIPPTTRALAPTRSTLIEVHIAESGEIRNVPVEAPDYKVVLPDDTKVPVYEFTSGIINFWRTYFESAGIVYKPQDEKISSATMNRNLRVSRTSYGAELGQTMISCGDL